MDLELARKNMIESQIRTWEVVDQKVVDCFNVILREKFVPELHRNIAYADLEIPLEQGDVMWPPKLEARVLQSLEIQNTDRVLEIGTGTGFFTALLARLASHVVSVDDRPELSERAKKHLAEEGLHNVVLEVGDAHEGWFADAPYDVIVVTGSLPTVPSAFKEALAVGGRLLMIVGEHPVMQVKLIEREDTEAFLVEDLLETDMPPLRHQSVKADFEF